jgi:3,4-dihydroxy-2-butanone 4-phosphate synthase
MIIVVDDEDRENEGDLTIAAEKVTPEDDQLHGEVRRGQICLSMTGQRLDELEIPLAVNANTTSFGTAFCVPIDARHQVTTGISAADRAATVRAAIDPQTTPADLARPGHVPPLRARDGGVLVRAGQTEAAVDLARMAGLSPAGVICEVINEDGTMARVPELTKFAKKHGLLIHHDRGPDPVPHADRAAREARGERRAAHRARRVPDPRVCQSAGQRDARRARSRRYRRWQGCPRPCALEVSDGRCVPLGAL